jgi:hypothetical protein
MLVIFNPPPTSPTLSFPISGPHAGSHGGPMRALCWRPLPPPACPQPHQTRTSPEAARVGRAPPEAAPVFPCVTAPKSGRFRRPWPPLSEPGQVHQGSRFALHRRRNNPALRLLVPTVVRSSSTPAALAPATSLGSSGSRGGNRQAPSPTVLHVPLPVLTLALAPLPRHLTSSDRGGQAA